MVEKRTGSPVDTGKATGVLAGAKSGPDINRAEIGRLVCGRSLAADDWPGMQKPVQ